MVSPSSSTTAAAGPSSGLKMSDYAKKYFTSDHLPVSSSSPPSPSTSPASPSDEQIPDPYNVTPSPSPSRKLPPTADDDDKNEKNEDEDEDRDGDEKRRAGSERNGKKKGEEFISGADEAKQNENGNKNGNGTGTGKEEESVNEDENQNILGEGDGYTSRMSIFEMAMSGTKHLLSTDTEADEATPRNNSDLRNSSRWPTTYPASDQNLIPPVPASETAPAPDPEPKPTPKKGWLAHQSIFPSASISASASSSSRHSHGRAHDHGHGRRHGHSRTRIDTSASPPSSLLGSDEDIEIDESDDSEVGDTYRARKKRHRNDDFAQGSRSFFGFGPRRTTTLKEGARGRERERERERGREGQSQRQGQREEEEEEGQLLSELDGSFHRHPGHAGDELGSSTQTYARTSGDVGGHHPRGVSTSSSLSLDSIDSYNATAHAHAHARDRDRARARADSDAQRPYHLYGNEHDHDHHSSGENITKSGIFRSDSLSFEDGSGPLPYPSYPGESLDDPLVDDGQGTIPPRLEIYRDHLGHWRGEIPLRKYKDSAWLALWLTSVLAVLIALCFVWGNTDPSPIPPSVPGGDSIRYRTPFSTLVHTIPLLGILVVCSTVAPMGFILLLRRTVRPVLLAMTICVPFFLIVIAWWSFIASFEEVPNNTGTDRESDWWGTMGLRLLSIIPLVLAGLFGRMMWKRRRRLERTVAVVELSSNLILRHPAVLLLNPALLIAFTVFSLPFLTLLLRLLLIGYYRHPRENTYVWHVRPYAGWLIALVTMLWLWSWVIFRGVGRVVMAAVIGEWYFHRSDPDRVNPTELFVAGIHRATGSNLGSICLSSLIVAICRSVGRTALEARRITNPRANILPSPLMFLSALTPIFTTLASILEQLNGYALVYVGVTGDAFWPSATRAVKLASRRNGAVGRLLDYTLVKLLLTLSSTTIALICATIGYLYVTHGLAAPAHAPIAALLCGGVSFLAVRAGCGVLADASDSVFICYAIDKENGTNHCEEAAQAFEGEVFKPTSSV